MYHQSNPNSRQPTTSAYNSASGLRCRHNRKHHASDAATSGSIRVTALVMLQQAELS